MKVLFLVSQASFFLSHRARLARGLVNAGISCSLLCAGLSASARRDLKLSGISADSISISRDNCGLFSVAREAALLCQILKKEQDPLLVHAVSLRLILIALVVALFIKRHRFVLAFSGLGFLYTSSRFRFRLMKNAITIALRILLYINRRRCGLIFQNHDDQREIINGSGFCPSVIIAGVGVSKKNYQKRVFRPEGQRKFLMAARLLREKGVEEFIAAAEFVEQRFPMASFVLVGALDPANPGRLTQAELELLLRRSPVRYLGHVKDIARLLTDTDIFVLPSYREGLSLALLEAAIHGCPILTTSVPGCREVVTDGVTGKLIDPESVEQLACAMIWFAQLDNESLEQMSKDGYRKVIREFNEKDVLEKHIAFYKNLSCSF